MDSQTYTNQFSRNIGILSLEQQTVLRHATVAVAGCGADGGSPALSLARLGVRKFRIADPDHFDLSNTNRQEGAFLSTLGRKKVEVIAEHIRDLHTDAEITAYDTGIDQQNIEPFLAGADILLEEIDYRSPKYSLIAHRCARRLGIPVLTVVSVAWNSFLFYFTPDGLTYEEYAGVQPGKEDPLSTEMDVTAYAPEIPPYLDKSLLADILQEKVEIPAIDPAVKMAAALASSFTVFILTKSKEVKPVPYYYSSGDLFLKEARLKPTS